jgi:hypothetical protein
MEQLNEASTNKRKLGDTDFDTFAADIIGSAQATYVGSVTEKTRLTEGLAVATKRVDDAKKALAETLSDETLLSRFLEEVAGDDWAVMYKDLIKFKETNGHCRVPRNKKDENTKLGIWVYKQRFAFRDFVKKSTDEEPDEEEDNARAAKEKQLEAHKVALLDRIGFDWDPIRTRWEGKLEEVIQWRKDHGGERLPKRSEDAVLGRWVKNVRTAYNLYKEGKDVYEMNAERVKQLQQAGIIIADGRMPKPSDIQRAAEKGVSVGRLPLTAGPRFWDEKYQALMRFSTFHGHFEVPYCNKLHKWVAQQRKSWAELQKEGKTWTSEKAKMRAQSDVDRLAQAGFPFESDQGDPKWFQMFNRLQGYHALFGTCNVRSEFDLIPKSKGLGRWVREQRAEFLLFEQDQSKVLDQEKVDLLESIHFQWAADTDV